MKRRVSAKLGRVVKRLAATHPKLPIAETVSLLVDQYRGNGTWYSPSELAAELPRERSGELLMVLGLLSGEPYAVLTVKWTILGNDAHAPTEEEDHALFEVSAQSAFEALYTHHLEHPLTGEQIDSSRLRLHYEPNFPLADKH